MIGRDLPTATRADLLKGTSRHALIGYIRIMSRNIAGGVALVSDVVAHQVNGVTYAPVGLDIATPSHSDDMSPSLRLLLPNIDPRIGEAIRKSDARMTVSIDWYTMANFDLAVTPRVPLAGARPIVSMTDWRVVDAQGGDGSVSLTIERRNIAQEPFPQLRSTAGVAPGLSV